MEKNMKKCPYCAEEILAEAIKCKHCGELLSTIAPKIELNSAKVQTVEQTGKKWKKAQLIGGVILGVWFFIALIMGFSKDALSFLPLAIFFGGGFYLCGKIGGWWYHG